MIEKLKDWTLPDWAYDKAKWILITGVPALIALITGLGALYGFDPSLVTGTISVIATFIGALIGVSSLNYNKKTTTGTVDTE